MSSNNAINTDSENRRSFVALIFTAGLGKRKRLCSLHSYATVNRSS